MSKTLCLLLIGLINLLPVSVIAAETSETSSEYREQGYLIANVLAGLNLTLPNVVGFSAKGQHDFAAMLGRWIAAKKATGEIQQAYDYWILGKAPKRRNPGGQSARTCSAGAGLNPVRAMTDQNILFILLFFVFVFLIWGRWRYDLVAFSALLVAVVSGSCPLKKHFPASGIRRSWS